MSSLFLNVPMTLVTILGVGFNGYILVVILLTKQFTTANNILLLHLGVVNVALGILYLTFTIPARFQLPSTWLSDGFPCILHGFLHTFLHSLSLWTICCLNCDRYYAIAAPLHYGYIVNTRRVSLGLAIGWFLALIFSVPPMFSTAPYTLTAGLEACLPNFSATGALWYTTLYTAFSLLLPLTLIVCCNIKVLMIARYHRHRIASAIYQVTLSAQVTITHQRNPFLMAGSWKLRNSIAVYTVLQIVCSLLVLYVPHYALSMWRSIWAHTYSTNIANAEGSSSSASVAPPEPYPQLYTLTSVLLIATVPVNGFIYGVKDKLIRRALRNYWRKKQTKNEMSHEIQARTPSTGGGSRRPSFSAGAHLMRRSSDFYGAPPQPEQQQALQDATEMKVTVLLHSPHCYTRKRSLSEGDTENGVNDTAAKWWRKADDVRSNSRELCVPETDLNCGTEEERRLLRDNQQHQVSHHQKSEHYVTFKYQRDSLKYAYSSIESREVLLK